MNQTFSLPRFGRLLRKYFTDNRAQLGANLALLTGLMLALTVVFYSSLPFAVDRNRAIPCFFIGWAAWYMFTWLQTDVLNQKERALNYLLQPASQFEKFLLLWLVSGVGFFAVYLLLFTAMDSLGVTYVNSKQWTSYQLGQIKAMGGMMLIKPFYQSNNFWPPTHIIVFTGLLHPLSTAFLLFIRRYSLPLVGVLFMILLAAGYFLNSYVLHWVLNTPEPLSALPFESVGVDAPTGPGSRKIDLPQPIGNQLRYAVGIVVVVLLYITAYFRLNEREV